jgi:hypothetical protein
LFEGQVVEEDPVERELLGREVVFAAKEIGAGRRPHHEVLAPVAVAIAGPEERREPRAHLRRRGWER